jgi:aryl-alcohol dehydrogenase-like predicted oxidoreductase
MLMRYRQLQPGIEVSEVGFGNWTVTTGWWGDCTEDEAVALHRAAFDAGVVFFDTSNAYREGYGEQVLGKALADVRDQIVIATKFGYDLDVNRRAARSAGAAPPHRRDLRRGRPRRQPGAAGHRHHRRVAAAQPAHGAPGRR